MIIGQAIGRPAREMILASVLLAMLLTMMPVPARAQLGGGIVFDPKNYALQVAKKIEEANRWVQTIDHYTRMYENAVRQLTTMSNLLQTAERRLGFDREMLTTISSVGAAIRTSFRIKELVQGLVVGRVLALKEIDDRLRHGIFDPAADQRDLEDYLKNGIGRTSQDALANMDRLVKMDNTIARADYDINRLSNNRAEAEQNIKDMQTQIAALKICDTCTQKDREIQALSVQIFQASQQMEQTSAEIERLRQEITQRTEAIAEREEGRLRFGSQVTTLIGGWKKLVEAKQQAQEKLSNPDGQ